jgi:hypothetical protein
MDKQKGQTLTIPQSFKQHQPKHTLHTEGREDTVICKTFWQDEDQTAHWDTPYIGNPHTTDLYLHANSEYHPLQKHFALKTFIHRARTICNAGSLYEEMKHMKMTFRQNGYSNHNVKHAFVPSQGSQTQQEKLVGTAMT